jgi:hypothetical protein
MTMMVRRVMTMTAAAACRQHSGYRAAGGARALSVWVVAGEPSGDAIGARLITALRAEVGCCNLKPVLPRSVPALVPSLWASNFL